MVWVLVLVLVAVLMLPNSLRTQDRTKATTRFSHLEKLTYLGPYRYDEGVMRAPASPAAGDTIVLFDNTIPTGSFFIGGADQEVLDWATLPLAGDVTWFQIGYATSRTTGPIDVDVTFYSGTNNSVNGTEIATVSVPVSASTGGVRGFVVNVDISASPVHIPAGEFGYSYTFEDDSTGPIIAGGGTGITDQFRLPPDPINFNFGGDPFAQFWLKLEQIEQGPADTVFVTVNQTDVRDFPTVRYLVSVTDTSRQPVTGLDKSNFSVEEDGQSVPFTVTPVGGDSSIISVALSLDNSTSISSAELQDIKAAATAFVDILQTNDRAAVFKFARNVVLIQDFTSDKNALRNAIDGARIPNAGSTSLFDAVFDAVELTRLENNRRAVILLTDGNESGSSQRTLQDAIDQAVNFGVPVFTIGLGSGIDIAVLQQIADETGGLFFQAPSATDLQEIYQTISGILQNQYEIAWTTPKPTCDANAPTRTVDIAVSVGTGRGTATKPYACPPSTPPDVPIFATAASSDQFMGIPFEIEVQVGEPGNEVTDLFGIGFVLNFTNTDFIDVVTPSSSNCVPGPFLGSDLVFVCDVDESNGRVSAGISRKAGRSGVSGFGSVLEVTFVASSNTPIGTVCDFSIADISAIDSNGNPIGLLARDFSVTISGVEVWPGDTDNSGIVNQADVLPLGLHFNETGPARTSGEQGCSFAGHPAQPWSNVNTTYADANGDGIVNQNDVLCIGFNFDKTHTIAPLLTKQSLASVSSKGSQTANLTMMIDGTVNPGDEFFIDIFANDVTNLFGLSFEFVYAPLDFVAADTVEFGSNNLLGDDLITVDNVDKTAGKVSIGLSRKSGAGGVDGSGLVARIKAVMDDNAVIGQSITTLTIENVQALDANGNPIEFDLTNVVQVDLVTDVQEGSDGLPRDFALHPNYPNPFNPETTIRYQLSASTHVRLAVYNLLGRQVATLVDKQQSAGHYSVKWNAKDDSGRLVASGVYLLRLETGEFMQVRKLTFLR